MQSNVDGTTEDGNKTSLRRGVALVLISAVAFGGLPIFARLAYMEGVNLKTLLSLRFIIAAIVMWVLWAFLRPRNENKGVSASKAQILPLVIMGTVGYVGQSFAYFTAVGIISVTATSLLLYTYPALVTLLSWIVFKERISREQLGALGLAGVGVILVLGTLTALFTSGRGALGELHGGGVVWALAASLIYSAYIIAGSKYTSVLSPVYSSAIIITSAAITYAIWGVLSGELSLQVSLPGLLWTTGLALISTVLAITTFFAGLRIVGASRASIMSTLEPAISVALAALVLGEGMSAEQLAGGALILVAVIVLQRGGERG